VIDDVTGEDRVGEVGDRLEDVGEARRYGVGEPAPSDEPGPVCLSRGTECDENLADRMPVRPAVCPGRRDRRGEIDGGDRCRPDST
jgi:hypothetical protein